MNIMIRYTLLFIIFGLASLPAQQTAWDSLNIHYRLVHTGYHTDETIIKIKVPPYLSTREVMQQIKLATSWPGEPLPKVRTKVYVFREDAPDGAASRIGGVYLPGKGFTWSLEDWKPEVDIRDYQPSVVDKLIYNTVLDSMFAAQRYSLDSDPNSRPMKEKIAREFNISIAQLDSIYFRVKWWKEWRPGTSRQP